MITILNGEIMNKYCRTCKIKHERPSNFCSYECFEVWYKLLQAEVLEELNQLKKEKNANTRTN